MAEATTSRVEETLLQRFGRRLRLGMVGGGADSVIGATHRFAFRADGRYELVAGAMSIDPEIAIATGRADLLDEDRIYTDFREFAARESERPDGVEVVTIATPPPTHFEIAKVLLEHGFDVICEKPMTHTLEEAKALAELVGRSGRLLLLTHCYSGYPLVREARELVRSGALGEIRMIDVEFANGNPGFLAEPDDPARRSWHFNRSFSGAGGILGDLGTHAQQLAEFIGATEVSRVSARLEILAARREVFDNAYLTVEFASGASGRIWCSYEAAGVEHGLRFRVFGSEGSLAWHQEEGEFMWWRRPGEPPIRLGKGQDQLSEASRHAARVRPGHPDGYLMAFATLYADFADALMARAVGDPYDERLSLLPSTGDGVRGLALRVAAERSHDDDGAWTTIPRPA